MVPTWASSLLRLWLVIHNCLVGGRRRQVAIAKAAVAGRCQGAPEAGHRSLVSRGASQQCLVLGFVSACLLVGTAGAESTCSVVAASGALCIRGAWSGGGPGWAALCKGQKLRITVAATSGAPCGGGTWSGGGPGWAALR
jgi:hypothetical protein